MRDKIKISNNLSLKIFGICPFRLFFISIYMSVYIYICNKGQLIVHILSHNFSFSLNVSLTIFYVISSQLSSLFKDTWNFNVLCTIIMIDVDFCILIITNAKKETQDLHIWVSLSIYSAY